MGGRFGYGGCQNCACCGFGGWARNGNRGGDCLFNRNRLYNFNGYTNNYYVGGFTNGFYGPRFTGAYV
jgi:hypothetical protein